MTRARDVAEGWIAPVPRAVVMIDACARARAVVTQESGVAASDVKKLAESGVHTVEGLARASRKQLCAIKGFSEQKVEKLKQIGALKRRARARERVGEGAWGGSARRTRVGRGTGARFETEHPRAREGFAGAR